MEYALVHDDSTIKALPVGQPFTVDGVQHPYKRAAEFGYPVETQQTGEPSDFHNPMEELTFDGSKVIRSVEYVLKNADRVKQIAAAKKDRAKQSLEVNAENLRQQYVAYGDTKPSVYRRKEQEYDRYQSDTSGSFPFAEARAKALNVTVADVMTEWGNTIAALNQVMLVVEEAYDNAASAIDALADDENVQDGIDAALDAFARDTAAVNKESG